MANLHLLVSAVLMFVGQSTACVEWKIANPPIIFGKTAKLSCVTVTSNISYTTHNLTSWLGGKYFSTLTYTGGTIDHRKYAEIRKWRRSKFESILQIYKFDEMDVNVDYSCSIGAHENRKRLSLAPDKFEYHPDKDTTMVLTRFRHGYLDVKVKIIKVYPIPKCTMMFNKNIISQRLTTNTSVNGIFYSVVEEAEHQVDACRGQLIITCVVGKTEIAIHQESFNKCTSTTTVQNFLQHEPQETKEESPEYNDGLIISISIGVMLVVLIVIGMAGLARHGKLKNVLCCSVSCRGEEMTLESNITRIVNQLLHEGQAGAANDAGQEESREMISHNKERQ